MPSRNRSTGPTPIPDFPPESTAKTKELPCEIAKRLHESLAYLACIHPVTLKQVASPEQLRKAQATIRQALQQHTKH